MDNTLINLMRDKERALDALMMRLGQTQRSLVRQGTAEFDEISVKALAAVLEDVTELLPQIRELKQDIAELSARLR